MIIKVASDATLVFFFLLAHLLDCQNPETKNMIKNWFDYFPCRLRLQTCTKIRKTNITKLSRGTGIGTLALISHIYLLGTKSNLPRVYIIKLRVFVQAVKSHPSWYLKYIFTLSIRRIAQRHLDGTHLTWGTPFRCILQ